MKRIDQTQNGSASFSRLRSLTELPIQGPKATSGRLSSSSSSSSTSANRSDGALEYWSVGIQTSDHFRGLSLELFARSVMGSKTVLPKAVKTAGLNDAPIEWGLRQRRLAATISLERRVVSKQ